MGPSDEEETEAPNPNRNPIDIVIVNETNEPEPAPEEPTEPAPEQPTNNDSTVAAPKKRGNPNIGKQNKQRKNKRKYVRNLQGNDNDRKTTTTNYAEAAVANDLPVPARAQPVRKALNATKKLPPSKPALLAQNTKMKKRITSLELEKEGLLNRIKAKDRKSKKLIAAVWARADQLVSDAQRNERDAYSKIEELEDKLIDAKRDAVEALREERNELHEKHRGIVEKERNAAAANIIKLKLEYEKRREQDEKNMNKMLEKVKGERVMWQTLYEDACKNVEGASDKLYEEKARSRDVVQRAMEQASQKELRLQGKLTELRNVNSTLTSKKKKANANKRIALRRKKDLEELSEKRKIRAENAEMKRDEVEDELIVMKKKFDEAKKDVEYLNKLVEEHEATIERYKKEAEGKQLRMKKRRMKGQRGGESYTWHNYQ